MKRIWGTHWLPILLTVGGVGFWIWGYLTRPSFWDPELYSWLIGVLIGVLWGLWPLLLPGRIENPDAERVKTLLDAYRERLIERAKYLPIEGIFASGWATDMKCRIALDQVFVPMNVPAPRSNRAENNVAGAEGLGDAHERSSQPVVAYLARLARYEPVRVVLLGEAGSGKSSVVANLLYRCAESGCAPTSDWPESLRRRAVLRVNLRDLDWRNARASAAPLAGGAGDFWRLVGRAVTAVDPMLEGLQRETLGKAAAGQLRDDLKKGGLLLLDGLDEVLNLKQRKTTMRLIGSLAFDLGRECIIVVTSRPYAYTASKLEGFREIELQPLATKPSAGEERSQVARLVHNWCAVYGSRVCADDLVNELIKNPDLEEMARLPLLLTLLVALALDPPQRPGAEDRGGSGVEAAEVAVLRDRAGLMEEATKLFVNRWNAQIQVPADGVEAQAESHSLVKLPPQALRCTLQRVSLRAQKGHPPPATPGEARRVTVTASEFRMELKNCHPPALAWNIDEHPDFRSLVLDRINLFYPFGVLDDGDSEYAYVHRLFLEYLAACELVELDRRGRLKLEDELRDWLYGAPPHWREVARFAPVCRARRAAEPSPERDALAAAELLESLLTRPQPRHHEKEHCYKAVAVVGLALSDLKRALGSTPARTERVDAVLERAKLCFDSWFERLTNDRHPSPLTRLELGRVAGRLGDARRGVIPKNWRDGNDPFHLEPAQDFHWVSIPGGRFRPGSDAADCTVVDGYEDARADDRELNGAPIDLPEFQITRYPITQAQFAAFTRSGGYVDDAHPHTPPRWWQFSTEAIDWWRGGNPGFEGVKEGLRRDGRTEADIDDYESALKQRDEKGRRKPWYLNDPSHADWILPNHPVIGVSWFEAMAFCGWLTQEWRKCGLGLEEAVSLPTEIEWERAARGIERKRWPWGDWRTWQESFGEPANAEPANAKPANAEWAGLGSTTAVGLFPAESPEGLRDMAGNVSEWTLTLWGADYYKPSYDWPRDRGDQGNALAGEHLRIKRGGDWAKSPRYARGADRSQANPFYWNDKRGFRVVRVHLTNPVS